MRELTVAALGLLACASFVTSVSAQSAAKTGLPDTIACPEQVAQIANCYSAHLESGAYLLAAMPKSWNGNLIVFAHGGPSLDPYNAGTSKNDLARNAGEIARGYAWIASSYRKESYGVQMAAADTDDARQFFLARIGKPKRTILHGSSYGGLVATKLIEARAKNADGSANYDGVLLNSGLVTGSAVGYDFRADLRAVYQYYCKNLPREGEAPYPLWMGIPADSKMTVKDMEARVEECTGVSKSADMRTPLQKQNLANIIGVMGFSDRLLTRHMQSATFIFRDVAARVTKGKSAYSNMGIRYKGSSDDLALNRDVARFEADSAAREALRAEGQPTGALTVPMISIHSINDPQVVVEVQAHYRDAVKAAGNSERLVQAFTDEAQHSAQSSPEIGAALEMLMQWIEMDFKPEAATIAEACEQLRTSLDGPCRYHPEFQPKPYGTKYYLHAAAAH